MTLFKYWFCSIPKRCPSCGCKLTSVYDKDSVENYDECYSCHHKFREDLQ